MKIVIDIEDYDREWIANGYHIPDEINRKIAEVIIDGIPLPKHHGRLIDADVLEKEIEDHSKGAFAMTPEFIVKDAPTIIEAEEVQDEDSD